MITILYSYKAQRSKTMSDLNKIKEICNDAISNPNSVEGLLIGQLAVNPNGFKFSETSANEDMSKVRSMALRGSA